MIQLLPRSTAPYIFGFTYFLLGQFCNATISSSSVEGGIQISDPFLLSSTVAVGSNRCSGFMISESFGITARHCKTFVGDEIKVNGSFCTVSEVFYPPGADESFNAADFVVFDTICRTPHSVAYFELPDSVDQFDGEIYLAGYGAHDLFIYSYPSLFQVEGKRKNFADLTKTQVQSMIATSVDLQTNLDNLKSGINMLFSETQGNTVYYGDSGGPIYMKTVHGNIAISVNSTLAALDKSVKINSVFGIFGPNISYYTTWIRGVINKK